MDCETRGVVRGGLSRELAHRVQHDVFCAQLILLAWHNIQLGHDPPKARSGMRRAGATRRSVKGCLASVAARQGAELLRELEAATDVLRGHEVLGHLDGRADVEDLRHNQSCEVQAPRA